MDNYRPLFSAAAAAQSGPDVWEALPGSYTYQYTAVLKPLNAYLSPQYKASLTGWDGVTVPQWSNSGTIYGIPSELQAGVWYYNKALFKKACGAGRRRPGPSSSPTARRWKRMASRPWPTGQPTTRCPQLHQ